MNEFLKAFPYLKPVNLYNLNERFQKVSNGTMMFLYNMARDTYELHSLKSFKLNSESLQAVIDEDALHGWLLIDFRANEVTKFGLEVQGERDLTNAFIDSNSERGLELLTSRTLNTIEKMIGREI